VEIRIDSPQFPLGASLNRYLRRRVDEELTGCSERVREVRAQLSDTRSSYGAIGKHCRLVVCFAHGGEVVVQSVETDLYVAIRRAADRLRRGLRRRLGRRNGPRPPRLVHAAAAPPLLGVS
jgi:ribosome-associated translation inhibitor RaiA